MHTATITKKRLRTLVEEIVHKQIQTILDDPDFGLLLTTRAERRLHHASRTRARRVTRSAKEIITRLRLPI